jgi:hypothetical protein
VLKFPEFMSRPGVVSFFDHKIDASAGPRDHFAHVHSCRLVWRPQVDLRQQASALFVDS